MTPLAEQHCRPAPEGSPSLGVREVQELLLDVPGWVINPDGKLARTYEFEDFQQALAFTNAVGAIAEAEGHHPDILLAWGRVALELWTHSTRGLTRNDFILAARVDQISN